MTRIDRIVLRRLGARVGLSVAVFFGLLCLVESLDIWRFRTLSEIGGPLLALTAIVNGAARVTMGTLPVTVLIGTIIGVLDLQRRRELTVILASGISIWQVVRAPVLAALVAGAAVSFGLAPLSLEIDRGLPITLTRARTGAVWLEQQGSQGPYILHAQRALANGTELYGVSLFFLDSAERGRIEAESATLGGGQWELANARRYQAQKAPEDFRTLRVPTTTTPPTPMTRTRRPSTTRTRSNSSANSTASGSAPAPEALPPALLACARRANRLLPCFAAPVAQLDRALPSEGSSQVRLWL